MPLLILAMICAISATAVVFEEVREGRTFGFDAALLLALRTPGDLARPIGPAWLTPAFIGLTVLGGFTLRWLIGVFAIGLLAFMRRRAEAVWLAVSLIGASLLNFLLKIWIHRPRPELAPHLTASSGFSFPSGHAMIAAAGYLTLGLMLVESQARPAARAFILGFFVLLVFLIGASRVYLGVHWPSDVLAAWAIGSAWALAVFAAKRRYVRRRHERRAKEGDG